VQSKRKYKELKQTTEKLKIQVIASINITSLEREMVEISIRKRRQRDFRYILWSIIKQSGVPGMWIQSNRI
jgi:hypothetical protein